jgi:hypothetical protein
MTPWCLYKHENCTDMAICPVKRPFFIPEKNGYKIKVLYYNIVNRDHMFNIGYELMETIFVKKEDIAKWKFLAEAIV